MSDNKHKGMIGLPEISFVYWYSREKEAEIDFEKNEITTFIDETPYTQKFHHVSKHELYGLVRYVVSSLFIVMFMNFSINIRNEIGLITAAVALIVWHQWRHNHRQVFKVNEKSVSAFSIMLLSIATAIFLFMIIGIMTDTLSYVSGAVVWSILALLSYEIVFSYLSEDWQQLRKVYVKGLPHYIPRYFRLPVDQENQHIVRSTRKKIDAKIYIFTAVMAGLGSIGLVYDGALAFKNYRTQKAAMEKYQNEQQLAELKFRAEQNGSVQTVIRYEKVKLAAGTEELYRKLNIPAEFKEIKTIVYPWEPGYRGPGTTILNPRENQ